MWLLKLVRRFISKKSKENALKCLRFSNENWMSGINQINNKFKLHMDTMWNNSSDDTISSSRTDSYSSQLAPTKNRSLSSVAFICVIQSVVLFKEEALRLKSLSGCVAWFSMYLHKLFSTTNDVKQINQAKMHEINWFISILNKRCNSTCYFSNRLYRIWYENSKAKNQTDRKMHLSTISANVFPVLITGKYLEIIFVLTSNK